MRTARMKKLLADAQVTIHVLQEELAETNRGLVALHLELDQKGKSDWNPHAHIIMRDRDIETGKRYLYTSSGPMERAQLTKKGEKFWTTKDFRVEWEQQMNRALERRDRRATILGATSGDTGAAAIEAFGGQPRTDVFILFPHGRVSDVQRRQMTTVDQPNVHAAAIEGSFDDCQAIVKALFGDLTFRDELGLSGVNSINWARILAQTVYYFTSAAALGAPWRPVSYVTPTGNFGDIELSGGTGERDERRPKADAAGR